MTAPPKAASLEASARSKSGIDSKMRDYVKANAEKAFDELSAEEAKH